METNQSLNDRFTLALREHRLTMYRVARSMLKTDADAEDAVSAATLSAYKAMDRIRDWGAIRPYLIRVTVNACHRTLRQRKREIISDVEPLLSVRPAPEETPLWMYLESLPPSLRMVLQLRYGEGLPLDEIAKTLGVPKGTVSSRIHRAQNDLKKMMTKEGR